MLSYIVVSIVLFYISLIYFNKNKMKLPSFLQTKTATFGLFFIFLGVVFSITSLIVLLVNNYWNELAPLVFLLTFMALFIMQLLIEKENKHAYFLTNIFLIINIFIFISNNLYVESSILLILVFIKYLILFISNKENKKIKESY